MVDVRLIGDTDVRKELERLREVEVNYALDGEPTEEDGWTFDRYCRRLAREAPGDPEPHGPWEVACELVRDYEFADPAIIKAVWLPDTPLADRTMLLEGRFLTLRFLLGCRVSKVIDETTTTDEGRPERAFGWCYRTLSGHLEAGEMCYRVVKRLDTGEVEFRVTRYVRSEAIDNPVVRLGWMTFGRLMQKVFVRRSLNRMDRLLEAELVAGRGTAGVPLAGTRIEVKAGEPEARRRLSRPRDRQGSSRQAWRTSRPR